MKQAVAPRPASIIMMAFAAMVAVVTLVSTQAAHAVGTRTLPTGDTLYIVDDVNSNYTLMTVDPIDATTTATGTGTGTTLSSSPQLLQAAYNPIAGFAYWLGKDSFGEASLYKVNLTTGDSAFVAALVRAGAMQAFGGYYASIAIGSLGEAFALDTQGGLYRLNLTTGATTFLGATGIPGFSGFSYNQKDGKFYAFLFTPNTGPNNGKLYRIETSESVGTATFVQTGFCNDESGITFDSNGIMWQACDGGLFSADPANPSTTGQDVGGGMTLSIFMKYPAATPTTPPTPAADPTTPELAATGSNSLIGMSSVALIAVALGAVALSARKRKL